MLTPRKLCSNARPVQVLPTMLTYIQVYVRRAIDRTASSLHRHMYFLFPPTIALLAFYWPLIGRRDVLIISWLCFMVRPTDSVGLESADR